MKICGRVPQEAVAFLSFKSHLPPPCSLIPQADVMADKVPRCPVCTGVVKPDIVFFGEQLPARFLLHMADFALADLLLILGTSLEVC